jgi:predicted helicase
MAKVYHSEIFGIREVKYNWLNKHNIKTVKWKKIAPHPQFYLFIPTDYKLANHYYSFYKITEIFPVNSVGIVTARDSFVIDFERKILERRIKAFIDPKVDEEILKQTYGLNENHSWKIKEQREKLRKDSDWKDSLTKILYRPFDERWILFHDEMIERTRKDVMQHLSEENIGLIFHKREELQIPYSHFMATDKIVEHGCLSSKTTCYIAPLYLYMKSSSKKKSSFTQLLMFEPDEVYQAVLPNISKEIIGVLTDYYQIPFLHPLDFDKKIKGFGSKEIFYFIYAVLYSNIYRTKYAEFLKIDFPRVPFTKDYKLFIQLGKLGKQLADLHLLKSKELDKTISKFPIQGSNKVEKLKYENDKIWINKEQYFDGVIEEVLQYQIGGYQVCEKWLKDRKERTLTLDEIKTYSKIVTALSKTIDLQNEIDKYFEEVEKTV